MGFCNEEVTEWVPRTCTELHVYVHLISTLRSSNRLQSHIPKEHKTTNKFWKNFSCCPLSVLKIQS